MVDQTSQGETAWRLRWDSALARRILRDWVGPAAMSVTLVSITTLVLWHLEFNLELDPLIFIYFVPTTYIALRYGSLAAMLATILSCIAAAYYLYPPTFSFAVASALELMQIVFFILLAMLASQVVSGFVKDQSLEPRRPRARFAATRAKLATLFGRLRSEP